MLFTHVSLLNLPSWASSANQVGCKLEIPIFYSNEIFGILSWVHVTNFVMYTTLNSTTTPPFISSYMCPCLPSDQLCALVYQVTSFDMYIWEQHLYRTLLICLLGFAEKSPYSNWIRIDKGHCFRMGCFLIVWEFGNCDWDLCLMFFFF